MANAIYLVVDENLSDIAGLQAQRVARQWECDVHIFVERRDPSAEVRQFQADGRIFYHFDELMRLLPSGLPEGNIWPKIVYLRIFAPQVLIGYERLLYIDADILPMRSDKIIWTMPMDSALGAVTDLATLTRAPADIKGVSRQEWLADIGIKSGRYFNSGVLLIDRKKWLEINYSERLVDYFASYPAAMRYDQDFLASLYDGTWIELSPRFNFQAEVLKYGLTEAINPTFIHFCGSYKPWHGTTEEWRLSVNPIYHSIYLDMMKTAAVEPKISQNICRVKRSKRVKYRVRAWLSKHGFPTRTEKRARAKWQAGYDDFHRFIANGLATGQFADETRTCLEGQRHQPVFDGRYVVGADSRPVDLAASKKKENLT